MAVPSTISIARFTSFLVAALLLAGALAGVARGEDAATLYPESRTFFPEADRFGAFEGVVVAAWGGRLSTTESAELADAVAEVLALASLLRSPDDEPDDAAEA